VLSGIEGVSRPRFSRAPEPKLFRPQDIVKLVVDEGDTTFRRKPKLPDVEPDTGPPSALARMSLFR
jgi:hypothetical protein